MTPFFGRVREQRAIDLVLRDRRGRLITIFTDESRKPDTRRTPTDPGCVHHIAFIVSKASWTQAQERLEARGIDTPRVWTAERDRQMWDDLQG